MNVNFVEAAELGAVKIEKMIRISIQNQDILLANVDGTIYAVDNICTHEDASLYNGALKGRCVECPLHGSLFDLADGKPQTANRACDRSNSHLSGKNQEQHDIDWAPMSGSRQASPYL